MIMQSYDFYYLFQHYGCNMQFGGDDQWSNMLGGTELIRRKLGKDAHAMTITLLTELARARRWARPPSGAVWLDPNKTTPYEFYQYWRNVGDADVIKCIRMLTFLPLEQIDEMDKWEGSQLNQRQGDPGLRAHRAGPRRGGGRRRRRPRPRRSSAAAATAPICPPPTLTARRLRQTARIGILALHGRTAGCARPTARLAVWSSRAASWWTRRRSTDVADSHPAGAARRGRRHHPARARRSSTRL